MSDTPTRLDITGQANPRELVLSGEVDAYTAASLHERLDTLGAEEDVTVDLAEVTFIDSSGLRALLTAHKALDAGGNRLVLRSPSSAVRRLLDIVGLTDQLHIVD